MLVQALLLIFIIDTIIKNTLLVCKNDADSEINCSDGACACMCVVIKVAGQKVKVSV